MQKNILKEVVLDQENRKNSLHKMVKRQIMEKIQEFAEMPHVIVISGIRRCGKSTLLRQVGETLRENNYYSINFEDERLVNFNETDFNNLYEILLEV